jgi:hypothetical protein
MVQGQPRQIVWLRSHFQKITRAKWTGRMTQVVECLLWKYKVLSSNPSPPRKKKNPKNHSKISGKKYFRLQCRNTNKQMDSNLLKPMCHIYLWTLSSLLHGNVYTERNGNALNPWESSLANLSVLYLLCWPKL